MYFNLSLLLSELQKNYIEDKSDFHFITNSIINHITCFFPCKNDILKKNYYLIDTSMMYINLIPPCVEKFILPVNISKYILQCNILAITTYLNEIDIRTYPITLFDETTKPVAFIHLDKQEIAASCFISKEENDILFSIPSRQLISKNTFKCIFEKHHNEKKDYTCCVCMSTNFHYDKNIIYCLSCASYVDLKCYKLIEKHNPTKLFRCPICRTQSLDSSTQLITCFEEDSDFRRDVRRINIEFDNSSL